MLPQIEISLGENILETLMVVVYLKLMADEIISSYLESVCHYG
jgi:hypothetical protein